MKASVLRDIGGILLIYAVYAVAIVLAYDIDLSDPWPFIMLLCSLGGMLLWYILGEWVIRPNAAGKVWCGTWFILLALIVGCACYVWFMEEADKAFIDLAEGNWWLHFAGGAGAYYVSSVLFSPTFAKYLIWPARIIRKW